MCRLNLSHVDTTPGIGEAHAFAPSRGWSGSAADYRAEMRARYRTNPMYRQRMWCIARFALSNAVRYTGPWAEEAEAIVRAIQQPRPS